MAKAEELAASAVPQLPQAALRDVPTPVRKRAPKAMGRPAKPTQPSAAGAVSDLWVTSAVGQGSYRERLQARGQEAMQRSFTGMPRAGSLASTLSPMQAPSPVSPMVFLNGFGAVQPQQADAWQHQQLSARHQQPWDLAAAPSPMGGAPVGASPMGMDALPMSGANVFAMGSPVAAADAMPTSTFALGTMHFGGEAMPMGNAGHLVPMGAYQQPFYPVVAPNAAQQPCNAQMAPASATDETSPSSWKSGSSTPAVNGAPWCQEGVLNALMPEAAQLDPEQIAAQLRAAAPCSYDD